MLGSLTTIPSSLVTSHSSLFLGITVGTDDEMSPRVQLGSVPFAVQALTVPDGSVTTAQIADRAVTQAKLGSDVSLVPPDGSITTAKIADGAVTTAKLNLVEGNVGIGTTTPNRRLQVGNTGDADNNQNALIERGLSVLGTGTRIGIYLYTDGSTTHKIQAQNFGTNAHLNLGLNPHGGNVGIGTTNPGAKLDVNGDFRATGTKSAVVNTAHYGQRKLYASESPEVRFFDEGLARLQDGTARVMLDPVFLETIEGDYLIHITPYGDASLYLAEVGREYFVVRAREGDPNVAFAWRLSATRKGYAGARLEEVK